MSARWGDAAPPRLPRVLRRREAERRRVEAFVAAIRWSANCAPACEHRTPGPRTAPDDTVWMPAIILTSSTPLR